MGPGAFFGEVALVTEEPRSATIIAAGPTQLLAVGRDAIRMLVGSYPDVLPVILRFLRDRLVDRLVKTHPCSRRSVPRSRVPGGPLPLPRDRVGRHHRQGARRPDGLYALLAGKVDVIAGKRIASLGPGDLFGEGSLLTGAPSPVTIAATTRCPPLCMPAADFREIIMTPPGAVVHRRPGRRAVKMIMGSSVSML
jgi:CRP-like cAMP-binding protein